MKSRYSAFIYLFPFLTFFFLSVLQKICKTGTKRVDNLDILCI